MGANWEDEYSKYSFSNYSFAYAQDPKTSKQVHDNVHGNIYLDDLALAFVDSEEFQRLRDLKQLVECTIFHSLAGEWHTWFIQEQSILDLNILLECIGLPVKQFTNLKLKNFQGLGIDHYDMESVKLAGLLHDVGHGPFSHLFEREFLPKVLPGTEWSHEQMSADMVDHIIHEHHIDIDTETENKVKDMILASSKYAQINSQEKRFLYDIVANGRNGIDVDKFDYIVRDSRACGLGCNFQFERLMESMRVMENEICYRAKEYLTIHKLFATRADLYRTVYTHAKVKAVELMVVDALVSANSYLQIASHIQDPAEYWKLDDTIIKTIETAPDPELKEARELILRIRRRELYKYCNEYAVPKENLENFKNVTAQDIVCSQKSGGPSIREEDVAVTNVRIDLTRGSDNPLESIKFFQDYYSKEKITISDDRVSHLLPTSHQDMIVRVYSKKPELEGVGAISDAFENFQYKTYGIKAQVLSTPEKKRQRIL